MYDIKRWMSSEGVIFLNKAAFDKPLCMTFFNYKVTKRDLIKRLFSYCTYCRYVNPGFKNQMGYSF